MPRFIVCLLLLPAAALAQVSTATLTGILTDASQARLPGVTLTLTNDDTGVATTAAANEQGEYTFPLVQPGRYRLTAEAPGFQAVTRTGIVLELGRTTRLDLTLQLGQLAQSIEVTGAAPLLESETSTAGQFIENKTIVDMPLNGRRVGELLGLVGGAVFVTGDVIRPRVTLAGGRADQQQWLLDGVNASNIALEAPQALFNPPVEAVQEIRVLENNYSAEFGNTSGGVVTMTTRSGTNRFTATVYEYLRNDKLDARNFFAADRPPLRWNVFGVVAGGPVIRNRTFFFSHIEWQRQRVGVTRLITVPTELERRGDFSRTLTASGALVPIYDPDTSRPDPANPARTIRTQFPGNLIPASRLDPVGAKLAALYAVPNRPPTNLAGANNFVKNATSALNITTWTSKVDHQLGRSDRLSGRFVLHDFPTYVTSVFDEPAADPNASINERRAYSLLVNEAHSFTPTIINDFRFNWQPRYFRNISLGLDQGWPAKLGLKGVSERAFPRVAPAGYAAMGPAQQLRIQTPINDTHIVNMISILRGAHAFKLGGEARLARNVDDLNTFTSGMLAFAVQPTAQPGVNNTGNAIASLLV
ncbi:MAG: carboxypeptidase regulatory-like domain-containing protein, partial [Gammaproteobacteria bacterium]